MSELHEELEIKQEDSGNNESEDEEDDDDDDDDEDEEEEEAVGEEDDEDEPEKEPADVSHYTLEEKIVAAVWVHERVRNHMTWHQMMINFKHRFKNKPPSKQTLLCWERKLFTTGNAHDKTRSGRPIARLMHVPYVKQSIEESPNLSIRERAKELGLPYATLLKILKEDLKMAYVQDMDAPKKKSKLHSPNTGGKWKFIENERENASKKQKIKHEKGKESPVVAGNANFNSTNNTTSSFNNTTTLSTHNHSQSSQPHQQPSSSSYYSGTAALHTSNQTAANQMVSLYQNYTNY